LRDFVDECFAEPRCIDFDHGPANVERGARRAAHKRIELPQIGFVVVRTMPATPCDAIAESPLEQLWGAFADDLNDAATDLARLTQCPRIALAFEIRFENDRFARAQKRRNDVEEQRHTRPAQCLRMLALGGVAFWQLLEQAFLDGILGEERDAQSLRESPG
jgi:hypothetical protein